MHYAVFACVLVAHGFLVGLAGAQGYPARDITTVVVWGEGGGTDSINRMIMAEMEKELPVSISVTNVTGGEAGSNGMQFVFDKPADGYTLVGLSESNVTAAVLGGWNRRFDVWHPFIVGGSPDLVSSTPRSEYLTFEALIADARANPRKIRVAASGAGSIHHLNMLALEKGADVEFTFVPHNGSGPSHESALKGDVDVVITSLAEQWDLIDRGQLYPLAMLTPEPGSEIPSAFDIYPEISEYLPLKQAIGFAVRADAPASVKVQLTEAFRKAMQAPAVKQWALINAYDLSGESGPQASAKFAKLEQTFAWTLDALGATKVSPEVIGIPRP
ncbi:MAG: tripartite tricarboxylate transporter substrate binding protein [Pseudomonadota bacterium]